MDVVARESNVIARIVSQGAKRRKDSDTDAFFAFSYELEGKTCSFVIPRGISGCGYSSSHLKVIEEELARIGLDLLPIDPNHTYEK